MTRANILNVPNNGLVGFTGTAFVETALTQYAALVGGSTTSTVSNITSSVAGQVLVAGGASANPAYVTPTAGTNVSVTTNSSTLSYGLLGGYNLIQQQVASSSSSLNFTTGISATYNNYILIISNLVMSSGSASNLTIQLSSNGGSTWLTTNYLSGYNSLPYNSTTLTNTNITTGFLLSSNTSSDYQSFVINLTNITNGSYPACYGQGTIATPGSPSCVLSQMVGSYTSTLTVNAIQLLPASGTITSGIVTLFAVVQ